MLLQSVLAWSVCWGCLLFAAGSLCFLGMLSGGRQLGVLESWKCGCRQQCLWLHTNMIENQGKFQFWVSYIYIFFLFLTYQNLGTDPGSGFRVFGAMTGTGPGSIRVLNFNNRTRIICICGSGFAWTGLVGSGPDPIQAGFIATAIQLCWN